MLLHVVRSALHASACAQLSHPPLVVLGRIPQMRPVATRVTRSAVGVLVSVCWAHRSRSASPAETAQPIQMPFADRLPQAQGTLHREVVHVRLICVE